jgi:hypothetical protein
LLAFLLVSGEQTFAANFAYSEQRTTHFGDEDVPLHANELRNPTTEQLDALSKFFREQQVARLAVTMSKSAVLPTGKTPLEIITGSMMNRYTDC